MEVDHPKRKKKKKLTVFLYVYKSSWLYFEVTLIDVCVTKDLKNKQIRLLSQLLK